MSLNAEKLGISDQKFSGILKIPPDKYECINQDLY